MGGNDCLADGQADSHASVCIRSGGVSGTAAVEYNGQKRRGDSFSVVPDTEYNGSGGINDCQVDWLAAG